MGVALLATVSVSVTGQSLRGRTLEADTAAEHFEGSEEEEFLSLEEIEAMGLDAEDRDLGRSGRRGRGGYGGYGYGSGYGTSGYGRGNGYGSSGYGSGYGYGRGNGSSSGRGGYGYGSGYGGYGGRHGNAGYS